MEVLLKLLMEVHVWCLSHSVYPAVGVGLVILFIGLIVERLKANFLKAKELEKTIMELKLRDAINRATPEDIAKAFGSLKTINIYYAGANIMHIEMHKTMIKYLVTHLNILGFKQSMTAIDEFKMKSWDNPVLCIHPRLKNYFFHNDQNENRRNSRAFTIETNCIHTLEKAIDNEIALMRGFDR